MRHFVRFARRATTPALLGIVLMSCEDDRITAAPHRPLRTDVTVPPPAGSYAIPTPANSAGPDGSALPEQETGITIPGGESLYVRVRVTGGILLSDNPDYVAHIGPTGLDGTVIGPRGMNPGECADLCPLEVRVWFYSATEGLGFVFNDMGNNVGERVERVTGPGRFTVLRAGFHAEGTYFEGGTCAPFQNPDLPPVCDPTVVTDVYAFDFSGQQTLSVDFVALALHASSTTPAPGEIVHFQAEGVNVTLGLPAEWSFRPAGAADDIAVPACADHLECDFAPPSDGVMFAQSWVGSGFVGGEVALTMQTAREVRIKPVTGALEVRPSQTGGTSTLPLQVGVFDTAGVAIPNQTVILAVDGIEQTGGHIHGGTMPPGTVPGTVNTGGTGIVTTTYAADVFAGQVEIRGTSTGARAAVDTIAVKVAGLVELLGQLHVETIGVSVQGQHPSSHWGTTAMVDALRTLGDSLYRRYVRPLQVNDISLPLGGKFDLSAAYGRGGKHAEHRDGHSADVRTHGPSPLTDAQRKFIQRTWEVLGGEVHDETILDDGRPNIESPHYHLRF